MFGLVLHIIIILSFGILFQNVSSATYSCSASATCGCSANSATLTRIVGGEPAAASTWGWAVSIRNRYTGSHFCGGSIISDTHILTAAHCTIDSFASTLRVYAGTTSSSSSAGQVRSVSKITNHPSYSSSTYRNDIAILKLSSPLDLNALGVDLVCLPDGSTSGEYPPANIDLVAVGWGVTSQGSNIVSPYLQQVTVQSVSSTSSYCRNSGVVDSSTQMCAGVMPAGGKDTCQGDSGGPLLMFTSNNVWEQVGITSSGDGCAQANRPGIYTRVSAYKSWIDSTMNSSNQICTISYIKLFLILVLILF